MITVIEIGPGRLSAVVARMNGKGPEIVRQGSTELSALEPAAVKAALEKCGGASGRTVLLVPRGRVVLRDLELPEGSPEELVAMVRFQVEREVPIPMDQVRYSFVETGRSGGKVRIQVAAAPSEALDDAVAAVEGAGVRIGGAYVSSYGLLSLWKQAGAAALIEVSAGEAEILIADGGRMEFSRTALLPEGPQDEVLAQEIDRTVLSWSSRAPGRELGRVLLAGEGAAAGELAAALGKRLSREVAQLGPGDLETATAAGLCLGLLRGDAIPDLLHPPSAGRRFKVTKAHRIGAMAGLAALLLLLWSQVALSDRRSDLEAARAKLKELEPKAAAVQQTARRTATAAQWYEDRNVWIRTLEALRVNVDTQKLWIGQASFEDGGLVRFQGRAKSDKHVSDLVAALKKTGQFADLTTEKIGPNTDKGDYRQDFTLTGHLAGYPAANAKVKK
jgi:Tfp pilus assembly protein PilN